MKPLLTLLVPAAFWCISANAQQPAHQHNHGDHAGHGHSHTVSVSPTSTTDSLAGFNADSVLFRAHQVNLSPAETQTYLAISKRRYIAKKYGLPNASGMRVTSFPVTTTAVAPCTNPGFETGDFTGWSGTIGDNDVMSGGPLSNVQVGFFSTTNDAPISDCAARHTIMTAAAAQVDPCGGFPTVPPNGGQYCVRMGNNCSSYMGETMEQTFTVDPLTTSFTYRYAVVLNDGGHTPTEQPYFKIEVLDSTGAPIGACLQYYENAGGSIPGYQQCPTDPFTSFKPWTTITYDLTTYVGQNVTVRFTVAGCIYGGHFGYAYVETSCGNIDDAISARFCPGNTGAFLVASPGFNSYQWIDPNGNNIPGATNDTLFVPNVTAGDTFEVVMQAVNDTNCITRLKVVIELTELQTLSTGNDPDCHNYTNGSVAANCLTCINPVTYTWNTTPTQTGQIVNGLPAGVYIVNIVDSLGCTKNDTVTLINPPPLDTAAITTQFCFGDNQITLIALPGQPGYQWYDPSGAAIPGATSQTITITNPQLGQQYSVIYSTVPCPIKDSIILTYVPPVNIFSPDSMVNVFTPNGDGQNDFFYPYYDASIANQIQAPNMPGYDFASLYVGTFEMWVYNRWGQEVFYTNDYTVGWNGQANSSNANEGVYYFVTKYTSRCYPDMEPITNSGFVHLLRK